MSFAGFTERMQDKTSKQSLGSLMGHLNHTQINYAYSIIPQSELSMKKIGSTPVEYDENLSSKSTVFSELNDDFIVDGYEESYGLSPKSAIEDYSILGKLSEGSQGSVFLTEGKHTKTKFALKVCKKSGKNLKDNGLKLETEIHEKLDHPFIVKFHESFENRYFKSLLLDFGYGGDLYFHLKKVENSERKQFSEGSVKFYICAIVLALQYMHDNGILFRDLKPENILIDSNGYPKLGDFGLSVYLEDIEINKHIKVRGSKQYYSPEGVSRRSYGKPSDWWTLGILTYELLFGKTPFEDANIFKQEQNIKNMPVNFETRSELSNECIDFISKLLSKTPDNRLGANGVEDFKTHPWLSDMDWDGIESVSLTPPYNITNKKCDDTQFFINSFTKEAIDEDFLDRLYE